MPTYRFWMARVPLHSPFPAGHRSCFPAALSLLSSLWLFHGHWSSADFSLPWQGGSENIQPWAAITHCPLTHLTNDSIPSAGHNVEEMGALWITQIVLISNLAKYVRPSNLNPLPATSSTEGQCKKIPQQILLCCPPHCPFFSFYSLWI